MTVTVVDDFTLDIEGETFVCFGEELNLTAVVNPSQQGLTYFWTRGTTPVGDSTATLRRVVSESNPYKVTVSDLLGCFTHTDSVFVEVSSPILLDSVKAQKSKSTTTLFLRARSSSCLLKSLPDFRQVPPTIGT